MWRRRVRLVPHRPSGPAREPGLALPCLGTQIHSQGVGAWITPAWAGMHQERRQSGATRETAAAEAAIVDALQRGCQYAPLPSCTYPQMATYTQNWGSVGRIQICCTVHRALPSGRLTCIPRTTHTASV